MPRGKQPAELLEPQEVAALLRACGRSKTGRRNQALIALLAGAGLRISEALALEPRDISFAQHRITVRRGKGQNRRVVTLDAMTAALIESWLQIRPEDARTLITTLEGEPVKPSYVRAMLPRLARKGGIAKRVHAHGLRHIYAVSLDRDRIPLAQIQLLLGHGSPVTTAIYLSRLRGVDPAVAERLQERAWAT